MIETSTERFGGRPPLMTTINRRVVEDGVSGIRTTVTRRSGLQTERFRPLTPLGVVRAPEAQPVVIEAPVVPPAGA